MAIRRMISKSISTSKRLSRVSHLSALLYTWTIPHCDDGGNMDADPAIVRGKVLPLFDISVKKVGECLEELAKIKAIILYEVEGEIYLHIEKFEEHQTLRGDRPDFRFPPIGKPLVSHRFVKGNHNRTERNTTEQNGTEGKAPLSREEGLALAVITRWNEVHGTNFKAYQPIVGNLTYWLNTYTPQEVLQAIVNVKSDNFWADKMTPVIMFRRKNPKGEGVDYIGDLLHNGREAKTRAQKGKIIV